METYTSLRAYDTVTCCQCGIAFGLPRHFHTTLRESGQLFYCPSGHSQAYCETEVMRLTKQVSQEKANAQWYRDQSESRALERDRAENRVRAYRGVITKTKKRISHGVCPACKRTFKQLVAHMAGCHPDYATTE